MEKYFAIDAVEPAMRKTTAFFSGPSLFRKWAKLAVLMAVFMLLSGGGGGNFNYSMPDSSSTGASAGNEVATQQINDFVGWVSGIDLGVIVLAIVFGLILIFIIGTILNVVKYTVMFSILNGITTSDVKIFGYASKYIGRSISLALFDLLMGIITLPFSLLMAAGILGIIMMFFSFIPVLSEIVKVIPYSGVLTNPVFIIAALAISIPVLLFFSIIHYIKGQFGFYMMYSRNVSSAFEGFKRGVSIVMRNKLQAIMLLLVQLALTIVLGIISFIIALIVAIPFALVGIAVVLGLLFLGAAPGLALAAFIIGIVVLLPLAIIAFYAISFALSPIQVFFFYYNLEVLENFMGAGAGRQKSP